MHNNYYLDINLKSDRCFVNESFQKKHLFKPFDDIDAIISSCKEDYAKFYESVWYSIPESYKQDIKNIQQAKALLCYYHSMTILSQINEKMTGGRIFEDDNFMDSQVVGDPIYSKSNDFSKLGGQRRYYTAQEVLDGLRQKYGSMWFDSNLKMFTRKKGHAEIILGAGHIAYPENQELIAAVLAKYNWCITQFAKHRMNSGQLVYKIMCEPIDCPVDTEEIRNEHRFLFHITTKGSVNSIKKNGLIPFNDKNPDVKYPKPRVYFTDNDVMDEYKQQQLLSCLKAHHRNDYFPVQFVLMTIDVVNIPEDVDFYYDLHNVRGDHNELGFMGYATDSVIPADCIVDIEDLGECSNENKFQNFINKLPSVLKNIILKYK